MNSIHNAQNKGEQARLGNGETEYIFVDPFQPPLKHRAVRGPKGCSFAVVQRFGEPTGADDAPEVVEFFADLNSARDLVMQRIVAEANRPGTGNDLYITHVKLRPAVTTIQ
ncbi:hypothetical protein [Corynebacterium resistens]|mgnify:CR=1 FL=1|uniref:hypothetical protein n=1 Tax=Corynebacterium resistens TaxID=258224 RepID=UPI002354156A|nr:hypothetical protein [Corynebacterium resistens]